MALAELIDLTRFSIKVLACGGNLGQTQNAALTMNRSAFLCWKNFMKNQRGLVKRLFSVIFRLPRWKVTEDWAPWNCVCLTETEARAHVGIQHLHRVYEKNFLQDVQGKNSLGLTAFRKLKEVDFDFVESGEWWNVGLDGKTV